jgi:hypothetical protein
MADVQTIFGNINSVIEQATKSIVGIKQADQQFKGYTPPPTTGAFGSFETSLKSITGSQLVTTALLVGIGGLIVYLLWRELR